MCPRNCRRASCWRRSARAKTRATLSSPTVSPRLRICLRAQPWAPRACGARRRCARPLGAHAVMRDGRLALTALVASADGRRVLRARTEGSDPEGVGAAAAQALRDQGADAILKSLQ